MSQDRIAFTRGAAQRIAKAVRIVEAGDKDADPINFGVRLQSSGSGAAVRFCSWTTTWAHGVTATITFDPATNATATAVNVYLGLGAGDGWVARKGTAGWHLIGADLTLQPSYSSNGIQMLGHGDDGIVKWYDITTCSTATA